MNIFFLDKDPFEAAKMYVDKHCVKMIVEVAQMLSTTHRILDGEDNKIPDYRDGILYKATHKNHPCTVWARTSIENYNWLVDHLQALLEEYTYRYGKKHKTNILLYTLGSPPLKLEEWDWTEPPCCMPDKYIKSDYVSNYREYYKEEKAHLHKWTKREKPDWIMNDE